MKRIQKTLALLLATLTLFSALSVPALAATKYKTVTMKRGTWYKVPSLNKEKKIYKLVLDADSIVTVHEKQNKTKQTVFLIFNNKKNLNSNNIYGFDFSIKKEGSFPVPLSKGTYYIRMFDYSNKPSTQIKVTVEKAVNKTNYCMSKAITLKANQLIKIAQTADHSYDRWYKITLSKKKEVIITTNEDHADYIRLYDAKMNRIDCAYGSTKVITEEQIPQGTYFIRVISEWYDEYVGDYTTLKWK